MSATTLLTETSLPEKLRLDGVWMPPQLREDYFMLTKKLIADVYENFGELNIVRIAEVITEK